MLSSPLYPPPSATRYRLVLSEGCLTVSSHYKLVKMLSAISSYKLILIHMQKAQHKKVLNEDGVTHSPKELFLPKLQGVFDLT